MNKFEILAVQGTEFLSPLARNAESLWEWIGNNHFFVKEGVL